MVAIMSRVREYAYIDNEMNQTYIQFKRFHLFFLWWQRVCDDGFFNVFLMFFVFPSCSHMFPMMFLKVFSEFPLMLFLKWCCSQ